MFYLRKPSAKTITKFVASQHDLPFSYDAVGATSTTPPAHFTIDHNRVQLGQGLLTYDRALKALKEWRQFRLGWVETVPEDVPLESGSVVAVRARAFAVWSLNACRIVYVISEEGTSKRFGFAYGTLPDHVERGEERFTIEWHAHDDSVWYDILAFSQPRHPLARLAFPLARMLQKRFVYDSMRVMKNAVAS